MALRHYRFAPAPPSQISAKDGIKFNKKKMSRYLAIKRK